MVRLEFEDLAANALIEKITHKQGDFVSYKEMEAYGNAVAALLMEQGEGPVVLDLSRNKTEYALSYFSTYFKEVTVNGEKGVIAEADKAEECLRQRFRGYLSLPALLAMTSTKALKELNIQPE